MTSWGTNAWFIYRESKILHRPSNETTAQGQRYSSSSTGIPLKGRNHIVWNSRPCYNPQPTSSEAVLVSLKLMDFQYVGEFITHPPSFE